MRRTATGLLLAMALLYIVARHFTPLDPAWGYVRAFAEAAMVGGLADWFAVTALFRHPMGLPIPHTAIIPRNKDRIGDNLALFLRHNFLTPDVVSARLAQTDMAQMVARWLQKQPSDHRLETGLRDLLVQLVHALDSQILGGLLRHAAAQRLRAMEVAPLLGHMLGSAVASDKHHPLLDQIIGWAAHTLDDNESAIRAMIRERTAWILRLASLDSKLADHVIEGLRQLLVDMAQDPAHAMRLKVQDRLLQLAEDLQTNPDMRARVEALKIDLIENPALGAYLDQLWDMAKAALLRMLEDRQGLAQNRFGPALQALGESIARDAALAAAINDYARRAVVRLVVDYGDGVVKLVSDTVRSWDATTISHRLEEAVGRDLQYIRINGTLIGGLAGVGIHALSELL